MSLETRQTLLHGQLQEGLRYNLMKAPAVSGAQTYPELCMAAKNEEKRQAELKKWQEYIRDQQQLPQLHIHSGNPRGYHLNSPWASPIVLVWKKDG